MKLITKLVGAANVAGLLVVVQQSFAQTSSVEQLAPKRTYGSSRYPTYGAIALSQSDGIAGSSSGSATEADAQRWAVYECRENGGKDCVSIGWERGRCAALAVGKDGYGFSFAANQPWYLWLGEIYVNSRNLIEQQTQDNAVAECQKHTSECAVKALVCN